MNKYRLMLFKLERRLTQRDAVSIARYFDLPTSVIDKIQGENPGTTLVIALEQERIICEDEDKLRDLHTTFEAMEFHDLAGIIEELHPHFKKVKPKMSNEAPNPVNSGQSMFVETADDLTPLSYCGETSDEGRPVMFPASMQVKLERSNEAENPVISYSGRSSFGETYQDIRPLSTFGETSDDGRLVMYPASTLVKPKRANEAESPVISNSRRSVLGEIPDGGRPMMFPTSALEDVPENVVGTDVSDRALSELSNYIGEEWELIAIESLSLKSYNIAELNEDYKKFRDKVYAMFVMWRKKNAGTATTAVLLEKLQARSDVEMEALDTLRKYL